MLKANRDGQEMQFEDSDEVLIFLIEHMAMRSELAAARTELKDDNKGLEERLGAKITKEIGTLNHDLRDYIDKKTEEVKTHTANILHNKEIISKTEALEYIKGSV